MKFDLYQHITDKIVSYLEEGNTQWLKGWKSGMPKNLCSKKAYRGINAFLLNAVMQGKYSNPYFLSFKQIHDRGGNVIKGEKGNMVIFFKMMDIINPDGEKKEIPFMRYYYVWNIEQTTLKKDIGEYAKLDFKPIDEAERIINAWKNMPEVKHGGNSAFYAIGSDIINIPEKTAFNSENEYYGTLFHEAVHSTGAKIRLNRNLENSFGDKEYSKEEIIAELGSAFLCGYAKMDKTLKNNSAYIQHWLKSLKEDKKFIFKVASESQKAVDYIYAPE